MKLQGRQLVLHGGRRWAGVLVVAALVAGCSAAGAGGSDDDPSGSNDGGGSAATSEAPTPKTVVTVNVDDGAVDVPVDTAVSVGASGGTITAVSAHYGKKATPKNAVKGELAADGNTWAATGLLEPGKRYTVAVSTRDDDGRTQTVTRTFRTQDLSLDQQAYASIAPTDGATVGVAMPIIVRFDIPVTRRADVERRLTVTSTPQVEGTWSWVSDSEVHYRPKKYWPAGTKVKVHAGINGVRTAKGTWGQEDRDTSFKVTDRAVTTVVDVSRHKATVRINGKVARVLPATTGKSGFQTRNGTKVIMEKYPVKRMDAATTGLSEDDPEYYNIEDVRWAMRVTNSGEFIHAAPWSVGSQGAANVSHGCTGLSTSNAAWLYSVSHIGDPVKFVNSARKVLEPQNGWTDWNISYAKFAKGSALS
ncbi:L,D-transpeptidase family protein [Mumia zhuanghuii]|uniref:Ig-like domain-containing protein n=2 Tax=Mumia TaxID=1546255 RepID=A0ABW1QK14_9ACTN|nr:MULTISPECIES: Ig-like domain-containing protein [Mumia]KAA1423529.1 L,D-transpeptidase family protein [Mumia zhuanghuii]